MITMNALSRTLALSGLFLGCWGALLGPAGAAEATQSSSSPDVLVVGGTAAGVAAAVAAARSGETVTLVSADGDLGDILRDGMMDQWDLNLAPDGAPLEGGLFTRMYDRLGEAFSGSSATQTLAALVASEPRIGVRYDEPAVAVTTSGDTEPKRIQSVVFADDITHARTTIAAPEVIDATDDADVAALAGARYDLGRQDTGVDEGMQPVTEMFALDDVAWNTLERSYDAARFGPGGATRRAGGGRCGQGDRDRRLRHRRSRSKTDRAGTAIHDSGSAPPPRLSAHEPSRVRTRAHRGVRGASLRA